MLDGKIFFGVTGTPRRNIALVKSAFADAERMVDRLRYAVQHAVEGLDQLDVSVGYAVFPDEGTTPEELMAHADAAAIETKRVSRGRRGRASRAA